jgi:hypothetical protein
MTNMSVKTLLFAGVATFGLCAGAQAQAPVQVNNATQNATAVATQATGAQTQGANTASVFSRAGGQTAANINAAANFLKQNNVNVGAHRFNPPKVHHIPTPPKGKY